MIDEEKKIEIITIAAIEEFATDDCKGLYDKDILESLEISADELKEFLSDSNNSNLIDEVAENIYDIVEDYVKTKVRGW